MHATAAGPQDRAPLREAAEGRLEAGTAPRTQGRPAHVDALNSLHRLASTPGGAADAVKLLHELQVHQVELDMQHEQIEFDRRSLVEERDRYVELFEFAPTGYACVDLDGVILTANIATARLFGVAREALPGRRLESLLASADRPALRGLVERLRAGDERASCEARADNDSRGAQRLLLVATIAPGGGTILMACIGLPDGPERAAPA